MVTSWHGQPPSQPISQRHYYEVQVTNVDIAMWFSHHYDPIDAATDVTTSPLQVDGWQTHDESCAGYRTLPRQIYAMLALLAFLKRTDVAAHLCCAQKETASSSGDNDTSNSAITLILKKG